MAKLAVNVDHVATVRQARGGREPDPAAAAVLAELAGADAIIVHLREDRRHAQDRDVRILRETVKTKFHLEMAATPEMVRIARETKPDLAMLVPEKRQELTTEGGLDVVSQREHIRKTIQELKESGLPVSLFIDADAEQIRTAQEIGADIVEIHTGHYADARSEAEANRLFAVIAEAVKQAAALGLRVNAGHGLNYINIKRFSILPEIEEFAIGHSIVSRAVLVGFERAVREMVELVRLL